jgi:Flp pilus assembly protein TadB
MAQTKRKRRTKHRGTAAGTIQTRGRTGRPPTAEEKKRDARAQSREQRLNTPPTWQGSFKRALLASALIFVFILVTNSKSKNPVVAALVFSVFALLLYVPAGYYLEMFLYRRRQRRKAIGR